MVKLDASNGKNNPQSNYEEKRFQTHQKTKINLLINQAKIMRVARWSKLSKYRKNNLSLYILQIFVFDVHRTFSKFNIMHPCAGLRTQLQLTWEVQTS